MKSPMIAAALVASLAALPAGAQTLMSCQVEEVRGSGENVEIVYSMNCGPVVGGDVTRIESTGNNEFRVTYGAGRPAIGGGPVYILRYNSELGAPGDRHYGAPLDGNVGTPRR
ncbi:hypothetical protein HB662_27730 [Roseomonas frigidaquae]|uniref:Uncharacterized protein n=1 Tax=Falsiroseomonas frigidaquae TaxID=487318 RepID=A0ABX1F877_9PROT|nr:hypothetical protein [Falsiroseomonas frigidaquae]NKE48590.1 hypothetical protein [Falsiroseomonas frigidaquae]